MIRLKQILLETSCPFPTSAGSIRDYLNEVLRDADTTVEVFAALNQARASWTAAELDRAAEFGACEVWNVVISSVLDNKGIVSQVYRGTPLDQELPNHYYCSVGHTIIDFVVGQFWGYGLGRGINDPDKVTFSKEEYADILQSYKWTII